MTAPVDLPQLTARIEQTIHRINNHWWNKRARPAAPDLRVLLDSHAALIAELTAARERLAELERAIEGAIKDVEQGNLYSTMCCSGHECGCRGSSYADLLVHDLHTTLKSENSND